MRDNFFYKFLIILFLFTFCNYPVKAEQFNFDVTEIEILNNGNLYKGLKRGTIKTDNGIIINADRFLYNKLTNIINAEGQVKLEDKVNNYIIFSDKAIYKRNEEIVFTIGNSKAYDELNREIIADKITYSKNPNTFEAEGQVKLEDKFEKYEIYSEKLTYFKNEENIITEGYTEAIIDSEYNFKSENVLLKIQTKELSSKIKSTLVDNNNQIYYLDEFIYYINEDLLKGKNILTITNYNLPKSDKFYFSDGIFNLKEKKFSSKDTKAIIHKNIFSRDKNDPRIYSVSSKGDNNKTVLKKAIFTSCKKREGCPEWAIKSDEIIHDKEKKQLSYKNAFINVYDIPVFYFPKFFHPDPTVIKQSGLLKPEINGSDVLGSSFTQPYYRMIDENKDFTISPTWSDNNFISIQNEFRQKNKNSSFLVDFGFVNNYRSSTTKERNTLSHFFLNYDIDLNLDNFNSSNLFISTEQVSNDTYLKVFDAHITKSNARPKNLNVMNSQTKLTLNHEKYSLESGFLAYEDLNKDKNNDRYEYVLPYYNFGTVIDENYFNGSITLGSSGSNKLTNTNNLKSSVINDIIYSSNDYISNLGYKNDFNVVFKNLNSLGKKNSDYKSSPQVELLTMIEANTSLPLIKKDKDYNNFLTPKLSFRFNPGDMKNYSTSSRKIDVGNIFSLNRLGLGDSFEKGRSLTLGVDYKKEKKELENINKYFEIKLATVIRDKDEDFIPKSSTIGRKNSNLFGSVTNNLHDKINLKYDFAIDNDLNTLEYNRISSSFLLNKFEATFNFIEENGEMGDRNIFENLISYDFNNSNNLTFKTRRNRKINLTEYYDLVYEYKSDCLTAGIKYKKTYYSDRDLKPEENLLFTITLFPLTTYEHDAGDLLKSEDSFLKNLELDSRMFK